MALGNVEVESVGKLFGAADEACNVHGSEKQDPPSSFPALQSADNGVGVQQLQEAGGMGVTEYLGPTATFRGISSADEMVSI